MAGFTQARQKVVAENIANVDTPGYRRKNVDLADFQQALAESLRAQSSTSDLHAVTTDQVQRDAFGNIVLQPAVEPIDNLTFHDGTHNRIESDLTEMARNQMLFQISSDLLARKYRGLETAIRGRVV